MVGRFILVFVSIVCVEFGRLGCTGIIFHQVYYDLSVWLKELDPKRQVVRNFSWFVRGVTLMSQFNVVHTLDNVLRRGARHDFQRRVESLVNHGQRDEAARLWASGRSNMYQCRRSRCWPMATDFLPAPSVADLAVGF